MRRRGFALLAVLWTLAAVSAAVGGALAVLKDGERATRNRVLLARGRWAAEACLEIAAARWAGERWSDTASIDLGRGTRCAWRASDPTARINLNTAERDVLERLFAGAGTAALVGIGPAGATAAGAWMSAEAAGALVDSIVSRRRDAEFLSPEQLRDVADVPDALLALLTTQGPGTVNAKVAPPAVLAALPGMGQGAVDLLARRRAGGRPIESLDELAAALSPVGRAAMLAEWPALSRVLGFGAPQLVLEATGWVEGGPPRLRAEIELVAVPLPSRLAPIRRWVR